ncbi:MAG: MgtC/SapB family protein [Phenylobacterium sp.]
MTSSFLTIAAELAAATAAGAAIGVERTMHGREGFRTHALVAVAGAAAAMVGMGDLAAMSRLAQGVMTGIGFVGAGVIFKEGVSVQGLTTAASMWATAAIGLLLGIGNYAAGALATIGVLIILVALRWVEQVTPNRVYAWATFRFDSGAAPDLAKLQAMLAPCGGKLRELSYGRCDDGRRFEFRGMLSAPSTHDFDNLAEVLRLTEGLVDFDISRINK